MPALSFAPAVNYSVLQGFPASVAVGDFNGGGGKQDLATANFSQVSVGVLLGNGGSTFQNPVKYVVGVHQDRIRALRPASVAVGDFNGDGNEDLTVACIGGGVSVLLGAGNGAFQSAVIYDVGAFPNFVAVGDFDGDARQDLAVAGGSVATSTVHVLLGTGSGAFQSPVDFAVGGTSASAAVGDFNGDGWLDLVTGNFTGDVSVLLNTTPTAPTITRNQAAVTVNEGSPATSSGTFDDPQGRGTVTLTASLGTVTKNDATGAWNWTHTPPDGPNGPNGPTTVTITATDTSGLTASTAFTLTVNNVAPTVTVFIVPASGAEGSPVDLAAAAFDPAGGQRPAELYMDRRQTRRQHADHAQRQPGQLHSAGQRQLRGQSDRQR